MMDWLTLALIAALIRGINAIMTKKILKMETAHEYLTGFSILTFLFLIPLLGRIDFNISTTNWGLLFIKGAILTVAWLLSGRAVKKMEISSFQPLTTLSPAFLVIFSMFILAEFPTALQLLGILFIIMGAYVLKHDHKKKHIKHSFKIFKNKYSAYIIFSMVLISFCAIIDKIVLAEVDVYTTLFLTFLFLTINYTLIEIWGYGGFKDIRHAFKVAKWPLFAVVVLHIISDIALFTAIAIPGAFVSLIIPVIRMSALFATVVGGELLHEHGLKWKIISCGIMVIGAILVAT